MRTVPSMLCLPLVLLALLALHPEPDLNVWGPLGRDAGQRDIAALDPFAGTPRPNVLVVTADDLGEEVYLASDSLREMIEPRGTVFENAFVTNPLCCPSRATMLRGQYSHNTGVLTNGPPLGGNRRFEDLGLEHATVATRLERAGYDTAFFGKYLNGKGGTYAPAGWERWMQAGWFDTYADHGKTYPYPEDAWRDDVLGRKAAYFLRQRGRAKAPLFMWTSFQSPHSELVRTEEGIRGRGYEPAERHLGERDMEELPEKPSRPTGDTQVDVSDKPAWVKESAAFSNDNEGNLDLDVERVYRRQVEMMDGVADNLRKIFAALEATGELDETYVIFTSDNGYQMGEHGIPPSKRAPYEESIGVPLVVIGPGVERGATRSEMVINNDIAPTVLSWAGQPSHRFADGRSFADLTAGQEALGSAAWRERFLIHGVSGEAGQFDNPTPPTYRGVKTERWKYIRYATGERELYDLVSDPYETRNLAGLAEYAGIEATLGARIDALKACVAESCREAEGF